MDGMPATGACSADAWQEVQPIAFTATWIRWLNAIGWVGAAGGRAPQATSARAAMSAPDRATARARSATASPVSA